MLPDPFSDSLPTGISEEPLFFRPERTLSEFDGTQPLGYRPSDAAGRQLKC